MPESGERAGYHGHKKTKGSKVHAAVDTLGHLLALKVTPASLDDRTQVEALSEELQEATGQGVEIAYVDQGISLPFSQSILYLGGIRMFGALKYQQGSLRLKDGSCRIPYPV
jgi:hypothetical protein